MAENYASLVYGPIFRIKAVPAQLTPRGGSPIDIKALDDTAGVEVEGAETLLPVVHVRYADLAANSIATTDLDDGAIAINGRTWSINRAREEPTPSGLAQGMVMLVLGAP
jgi:hypothetical protein